MEIDKTKLILQLIGVLIAYVAFSEIYDHYHPEIDERPVPKPRPRPEHFGFH